MQSWYDQQRAYYRAMISGVANDFRILLPEIIVAEPDASIYLVVDVRNIVWNGFDEKDFALFCAKKWVVEIDIGMYTLLFSPLPWFYQVKNIEGNPWYTQFRIAFVESHEVMGKAPFVFSELLKQYLASKASYLAKYFSVALSDVEGYILRKHGDSQVPIYSSLRIAGADLNNFAEFRGLSIDDSQQKLFAEETKNSGAITISKKMATYYGIASLTYNVVKVILRNENCFLPVSTLQETSEWVLCTSWPVQVSRSCVGVKLPLSLSLEEEQLLKKSHAVLANFASLI